MIFFLCICHIACKNWRYSMTLLVNVATFWFSALPFLITESFQELQVKRESYEIYSSKYYFYQKPLRLMKIRILLILSKQFGLTVYEYHVINDFKLHRISIVVQISIPMYEEVLVNLKFNLILMKVVNIYYNVSISCKSTFMYFGIYFFLFVIFRVIPLFLSY